jgi:hypothetical protein
MWLSHDSCDEPVMVRRLTMLKNGKILSVGWELRANGL